MFEVAPIVLASVYVCTGLGIIAGCWIYFDLRDSKRHREDHEKSVFHCIHCERLYQKRARKDVGRCPNCGKDNLRLRF